MLEESLTKVLSGGVPHPPPLLGLLVDEELRVLICVWMASHGRHAHKSMENSEKYNEYSDI